MANKKLDSTGQIENTTGTELDILKKIEKQFYNKNPDARKRNTAKSAKWFKDYISKNWQHVRTSQMMRDQSLVKQSIQVGGVYLVVYDALHKDKLPVWDAFPMVMPFNRSTSKAGDQLIHGLNLHYLSPALRLVALKAVLTLRSEKRYRKSTRLKMTWDALKAMAQNRLFKHCVKTYRVDHFKSKFIEVPIQSLEMVTFLPLARWQKGSKSTAQKMK